MTYETAQALRWWFIANIRNTLSVNSWCLETRIVPYKIKYDISATKQEAIEPLDSNGKSVEQSEADT